VASSLLLQDACVLLNILGSGRFSDIARGIERQFAISKAAAKECLFLHDARTGDKEAVDLDAFVRTGELQILNVEGAMEQSLYVAYAVELDDGEAMSLALAQARRIALATDDRKARALVTKHAASIDLWSTPRILQEWQVKQGISPGQMRIVINEITNRCRFFLKPTHPDWNWWSAQK
jgi:predicted nucleic acid-binding protein